MARLDGKVALITGAAQGQGAAEARLFVEEGARVVLTDVLDELGAALAAELGDAATYQHLNVAKPEDWKRVIADVKSRHGALHVLLNNAAISRYSRIEDCEVSDFEGHYRVNQLGPWLGIKTSLALMEGSAPASIINVASVSAMRGSYGGAAYSASKNAVVAISKCLAVELSPRGIRVNTIFPGGVATEMARATEEEWLGGEMAPKDAPQTDDGVPKWELPLRRIGRPDELASLALFLASDDSSYCTGADFVADGGLTAGLPFPPGGQKGPQRVGAVLDA
jgi:3alpha(or 20beta)-hydroxysteroid dehydrogenase